MGNGAPYIREMADVVTESNDLDGVAEAIENHILQ